MNFGADSIARYKNAVCVANLLLCLIFIIFEYAEVKFNSTVFFGMFAATLGPVFWNEWLYDGLFENSAARPIRLRTFLWIGLLMALAVSIALLTSFFRGTL